MQNSVETRITVVDTLRMQNGLQDRLQPSAACFGFKLSCVCCTCRCRSLRGCSRKISQCQLQVVHQWGTGYQKDHKTFRKTPKVGQWAAFPFPGPSNGENNTGTVWRMVKHAMVWRLSFPEALHLRPTGLSTKSMQNTTQMFNHQSSHCNL